MCQKIILNSKMEFRIYAFRGKISNQNQYQNAVKIFPIFRLLQPRNENDPMEKSSRFTYILDVSLFSILNLFLGEFSCSVLYVWHKKKSIKTTTTKKKSSR